ncbi:MAG: hypothetical protein QOC74_4627, partial [Pseudonocardiales bacterium]|nr:hypothetical protein [Pseudonocardiales bacterium]
ASAETRAGAARWGRRRVAEVYNWAAVCDGYEAVLRKTARDADSDSRSRIV